MGLPGTSPKTDCEHSLAMGCHMGADMELASRPPLERIAFRRLLPAMMVIALVLAFLAGVSWFIRSFILPPRIAILNPVSVATAPPTAVPPSTSAETSSDPSTALFDCSDRTCGGYHRRGRFRCGDHGLGAAWLQGSLPRPSPGPFRCRDHDGRSSSRLLAPCHSPGHGRRPERGGPVRQSITATAPSSGRSSVEEVLRGLPRGRRGPLREPWYGAHTARQNLI